MLSAGYYGRPATDIEIAAAMGEPSGDLAPPHGLLVAQDKFQELFGCQRDTRSQDLDDAGSFCAERPASDFINWISSDLDQWAAAGNASRESVRPLPVVGPIAENLSMTLDTCLGAGPPSICGGSARSCPFRARPGAA